MYGFVRTQVFVRNHHLHCVQGASRAIAVAA